MNALLESLRDDWTSLVRIAPRLVAALLVFLVAVWIGRRVGRIVARLLERGVLTSTHRNFFRHLVAWAVALAGLVIALNLLGLRTMAAGLLAGGGMTAVALGFAFREIGENLLAGLFLAFSRPFDVGDFIQSGSFTGKVRGLELRCTHIRTQDGRDVYIPSSQLFNEPLVNFTKDGLRRLSFTVGVDYRDDSAAVRATLLEAVRSIDRVLADPAPSVSLTALQPNVQEFEIGFWIDTFDPGTGLPAVRTAAIEACRKALADGNFVFSSEISTAVVVSGSLGEPDAGT